ncbi:hypothetical protein [Oligella sp. HMSC09E12]|uniref:hypothetical protein n=1 Tax=Oligella sp. HMSC09E12 TaxID=1581147 RepID=UPI0008A32B12|nr:hypothetical protein [Oligella sp. HMSC09E12]OFV47331.1 hypothetical protein HMPREF3179_08545 [Oligella sp. HMSC09E12]
MKSFKLTALLIFACLILGSILSKVLLYSYSVDVNFSYFLLVMLALPITITLWAVKELGSVKSSSQKNLRNSEFRRLKSIVRVKSQQIVFTGCALFFLQLIATITYHMSSGALKLHSLSFLIGCALACVPFITHALSLYSEATDFQADLERKETNKTRVKEFLKDKEA